MILIKNQKHMTGMTFESNINDGMFKFNTSSAVLRKSVAQRLE